MSLQQALDRRIQLLQERIRSERSEVCVCYAQLQQEAIRLSFNSVNENVSSFSPAALRDRASWVSHSVSKLNEALARLETLEAQLETLNTVQENAGEV